jgi:Domain of unknown function (DUF4145)
VSVDCPRCDARVKADVLATEDIFEKEMPDFRVSLARCPGCHLPLLTREEWDGMSLPPDDIEFERPTRVWPEPDRRAHAAVPAIVQVSLEEAHKCRRAGANTACAVMCGRALEGVCVHFGLKSMLSKGLTELKEKGLIDDRLFQWGEQLRKHRNIAAHASEEKTSREDATDLIEFVAAICEYIFVLTARFDAFMARKRKAPPVDILTG